MLSYLVANVKQPPSKPQNLEAKEVTTNSVTLEWESGFTTAAQYQVYRYMPNNTSGTKYALLGTVSGLAADKDGKYTLTDTKVQPSTQYQYVLKSVGTGRNIHELYRASGGHYTGDRRQAKYHETAGEYKCSPRYRCCIYHFCNPDRRSRERYLSLAEQNGRRPLDRFESGHADADHRKAREEHERHGIPLHRLSDRS